MEKVQIAHDLAVARMAGKQLPVDILVEEYKQNYDEILKYLRSQPVPHAKIHNKKELGF